MKPRIIAVDFDGTCVTHEFPEVGKNVGAAPILKLLADRGHKLILWTMRSGKTLQDAVDWFSKNEIPLFGVNVNPEQGDWSASPKAYAHLYIDDAAFGAPLVEQEDGRPFIDWDVVSVLLEDYI